MHSLIMMALAAVGVSGGPMVVVERTGGAVADDGWYAVKAVTSGAREQEPAALAFYDARPGAPEDRPLGTFSVQVMDGSTPRLQGARAIAFKPYGWEEHPVDGALSADVAVFCIARNTFYVLLSLHGVTPPLSLVAVLQGTGVTGTAVDAAVSVDAGAGRTFGVFAGSTAAGGSTSLTEGVNFRWQGTYPVSADQTVGFVLLLADSPVSASITGPGLLANSADAWLGPVQYGWGAYLASFPGAGAIPQPWADADAIAKATLRHNQDQLGEHFGVVRSKTAADHFYLLDTPIAALAISETQPYQALLSLDPLLAGQLVGVAEDGLIPNHVNEMGVAPSLGLPSATDAYSAPPVLPVVLRTLWDRSLQDQTARSEVEAAYRASAALHRWWTRRRDVDANGSVEVNGALEAEMPDSPRFALWGADANLPVPDTTPRASLDAVDVNAWLQWGELELWRTGTALGLDDALPWLDQGNARAQKVDDAAAGFWDDAQGAWVDYALDASQAKVAQGPRTPASFWPLATGTERDAARVRRAVAALTNPSQLWVAHGVASVSATTIGFQPDVPWRGAVSPWQTYFILQGLYRYGFEEEAEQLRTRLLDTIAAQPAMFAHYGAFSGAGVGAAGTSTTAAVFIEALRRRYEEETFALSSGNTPTVREGQIRRMYRFSDGVALAEVSVDGTRELPRTRFAATAELFSGSEMTITFSDPTREVARRGITLSFPVLDQAEVEVVHPDGSSQVFKPKAAPVQITARFDDTVRLRNYHFTGERACGCAAGEGAPLGAAWLLIAMAWRKRRKSERRTASASQRGRRCL
ncbi:MAG TPA: trehalase family glycosidase [Myxococcaceae bacterium]|nr:trehalase family glycosidase [Myxococcaceae bacterium]